ncbi:MAG: DNA primase [Phycisphaerales bacterium]|nr:MAG: DNA primase [Phycisphaerales bacterium]
MAGMFDNREVLEVQQANDIVDVVGEHVSLKKKGREMVGLCPFHADHRPSLNVNSVKQIFKCFACGAGGDVFKFVQMRENLTFPQAIERLAERAGIRLQKKKRAKGKREKVEGPDGEVAQVEGVDPNRLSKANAWAADQFRENLEDPQKGRYARDYLAQRQIDAESVRKWQLGLAVGSGNDLVTKAKARKASLKLLEQAGLIVGQNKDKFVNRLMFTITDVTGRVIGFGGRTLDENGAKYMNSPTTVLFDKSNSLYGLEQARHEIVSTATAVVVEGYTDVIMAHQFGCTNVVATLGTSFTAGHARILRRYARRVVLIFDSDVAGTEAANRALDVCLAQRIDIKIASVPDGKDPCDFILSAGRQRFEQVVDQAVDVFQFKWDRLKEKFNDEQTHAGRRAAVEEYIHTIAAGLQGGNVQPLDCGLRVNQISRIIGIESSQINVELGKHLRRARNAAGYERGNQQAATVDYGHGAFAVAQREVLEVLLNEPTLYAAVRQKITADVFDVPILSQIGEIIFETLDLDSKAPLRQFLARTESVQLGNCLMELAQAGQVKGNFEWRLAKALDAIERHQARKKRIAIEAQKNESDYLRKLNEMTDKVNVHTTGM